MYVQERCYYKELAYVIMEVPIQDLAGLRPKSCCYSLRQKAGKKKNKNLVLELKAVRYEEFSITHWSVSQLFYSVLQLIG